MESRALRADNPPPSPLFVTQLDQKLLRANDVDLRQLISHNQSTQASVRTEDVARAFTNTNVEFLAILDGDKLVGMCSRHELSALLGGRYGFSLFSRDPIRKYLRQNEIRITVGDPIGQVLATVFARGTDQFYDDVLLVDEAGKLVGLIATETLFKVQNALLRGNIVELETKEREIRTRNEQMETDLLMAMELQQALLPREYPVFPATATPDTARLRFAHLYHPASLVGGDFFHVVRISDREAGVFIFDVMGHGVRSALVTAMLRALITAESANLQDPGLLMTRVNSDLTAILKQTGTVLFVTSLYCLFDCETLIMRYARAGHPPPLLARRSVSDVSYAPGTKASSGPALGLFDRAPFVTTTTQLTPGDLVLLFTDGIIEAENVSNEEWGTAGLQNTVQNQLSLSGPKLLESLLAEAQRFTGATEFADDVCLAAVELSA